MYFVHILDISLKNVRYPFNVPPPPLSCYAVFAFCLVAERLYKIKLNRTTGMHAKIFGFTGSSKRRRRTIAVVKIPPTTQNTFRTDPACFVTWPTKIPPLAFVTKGIRVIIVNPLRSKKLNEDANPAPPPRPKSEYELEATSTSELQTESSAENK